MYVCAYCIVLLETYVQCVRAYNALTGLTLSPNPSLLPFIHSHNSVLVCCCVISSLCAVPAGALSPAEGSVPWGTRRGSSTGWCRSWTGSTTRSARRRERVSLHKPLCVYVCAYVRMYICICRGQTFFSLCLFICLFVRLAGCLTANVVPKPLRFLERIEKPPPRPPTPTVDPVPEVPHTHSAHSSLSCVRLSTNPHISQSCN